MLIGDRLTFGKCELRQRFGYCRGDDGAENFWIGAAPGWLSPFQSGIAAKNFCARRCLGQEQCKLCAADCVLLRFQSLTILL